VNTYYDNDINLFNKVTNYIFLWEYFNL